MPTLISTLLWESSSSAYIDFNSIMGEGAARRAVAVPALISTLLWESSSSAYIDFNSIMGEQ